MIWASSGDSLTAVGYQNVMWGSDYQHVESTFGHTRETLHELFDSRADEVRDRITVGAFLGLFSDVDEPAALMSGSGSSE